MLNKKLKPDAEIRPMLDADLNDVTQLVRQASEHAWTAGQIRDSLEYEYDSCWLLCEKTTNRILAYAVFRTLLDESQLLYIAVDHRCQGQGYGTVLLQHLIESADGPDAHSYYLEVRASNQAAIRLYEKLGFVKTGVRKNYYPALLHGSKRANKTSETGREDAWLYSLSFLS